MPQATPKGLTAEHVVLAQISMTNVPLSFEILGACRVENPKEVEEAFLVAFAPQRLNPKREFCRIDPTQAIAIMQLLHKPDATAEVVSLPTDVDEASIAPAAQVQAKVRRPNLDFHEMDIQDGSVLEAVTNLEISVVVTSAQKVRLGDDELSPTSAPQQAFPIASTMRLAPHRRYQGKLLSEFYGETFSAAD